MEFGIQDTNEKVQVIFNIDKTCCSMQETHKIINDHHNLYKMGIGIQDTDENVNVI